MSQRLEMFIFGPIILYKRLWVSHAIKSVSSGVNRSQTLLRFLQSRAQRTVLTPYAILYGTHCIACLTCVRSVLRRSVCIDCCKWDACKTVKYTLLPPTQSVDVQRAVGWNRRRTPRWRPRGNCQTRLRGRTRCVRSASAVQGAEKVSMSSH